MLNKFKFLILFLVISVMTSSIPVFAATYSTTQVPYENYTYWEGVNGESKKAVHSKAMFLPSSHINSQSLGIEPFKEIKDVFSDDNGKVYILDSRASRIVVLNEDYTVLKDFTDIDDNGNKISFVGARGIFVSEKGNIYIADTENNRIVIADSNGNLIKIIEKPQTSLIPDDFEFRPVSLVLSNKDDMYVLCDGSFYGAVVFNEHLEFQGFYGSNTVTSGIIEGIASLWNGIFMSDNKRENSEKKLPYQFTDLCIDSKGFIYTVTGKTETDSNSVGQIKKLSPSGTSILGGDSYNYVDEGYVVESTDVIGTRVQDLLSIDVDEEGYIYALDSTYGRIFVYNSENRLMSAFGGGIGKGTQLGTFTSASQIDEHNGDILICDSTNNNITVFKPTEYGINCFKANILTMNGDYASAKPLWQEIINQDSNNQLAYVGLAKAYISEGDYSNAIDFAKNAYDKELYDQAFEQVRRKFIGENFTLLFFGIIAIVGLIIFTVVFVKKKKITLIKNKEIRLMFNTIRHPVNTFDLIKENNSGSVLIAGVLVLIYYIVTILKTTYSGFAFNDFNSATFNSVFVLIRSVGAVVLWSICNWGVCTLFNGKGTIRKIFICTGYSIIPLIFGDLVYLVTSNIFTADEGAFLGIFSFLMMLFTVFYMSIAMIRLHDYSFGEFVLTSVLTILGIVLIIFFLFLVGVLLQQAYGFIVTILSEVFTGVGGLF